MMNLNYIKDMLKLRMAVCADEEPEYSVLNNDYENTGGNCMVSISTVWMPQLNQTVFVVINDDCGAIYTLDHIRNDIEIAEYDEITLDITYWAEHDYTNRFYGLYTACRFYYIQEDCKFCRQTVYLEYDELSEELKDSVSEAQHRIFAENEKLYETDGFKILNGLETIPGLSGDAARVDEMRRYFDSLMPGSDDSEEDDQKFYDIPITIRIGDHETTIGNCAAFYEALHAFAKTFQENY